MNNFSMLLAIVLFIGVANANLISLRSNIIRAEPELFQVFIASAGQQFDFGAGIVLSPRHVLTAATLVKGFSSWNIGFGSNEMNTLTNIESTVAFIHPNYDDESRNNNLAIIVLPRPFPDGSVKSVIMPSPADGVFPRLNHEGRVVGFGSIAATLNGVTVSPNPFMKTVYLTVVSNRDCTDMYPLVDGSRNFCARDEHAESMNVCKGDLGSAFIVSLRGQKILAGISSIASEQCTPTERTGFVRVQSYLSWIHGVMA